MESTEAGPAENETESVEVGPTEVEIESIEAGPAEEEIQIIKYFACPKSKDLSLFFQYHPQQTPRRTLPNIFRDGINCKWLTYCEESHALFCTVCLAFSNLLLLTTLLLEEACNPGSMYVKELRSMKEVVSIETVQRLTS